MTKHNFMRNFNWMMVLAILFSFSSCLNNAAEEEISPINPEEAAIKLVYDQIVNAEDFETRKLLHAALTNEEEVDFWHYHINTLVALGGYDQAQLDYFKATKDFIEKALIPDPDPEGELAAPEVCLIADIYISNTPEEVFNEIELALMFSLSKMAHKGQREIEDTQEGRNMPVCNCYSTFWDCSGNDKCSWKIRCTTPAGAGCGFFGWCDCNGRCW